MTLTPTTDELIKWKMKVFLLLIKESRLGEEAVKEDWLNIWDTYPNKNSLSKSFLKENF